MGPLRQFFLRRMHSDPRLARRSKASIQAPCCSHALIAAFKQTKLALTSLVLTAAQGHVDGSSRATRKRPAVRRWLHLR